MKRPGEDWVTAVENIPPSRLSVEITGLEKGWFGGGALLDVVPCNYDDDALSNYSSSVCKFITIMSIVKAISVIAAINQNITRLQLTKHLL